MQSSKRILFVNSGLRYGGAETQLIALVRELRRLGNEVALYLLTQDAPRLPEIADLGVSIVVDSKRSRLDFGVIKRLRSFICEWRPNIAHSFLFDANIFLRLASAGLDHIVLNAERSNGYRLATLQAVAHVLTRKLVDGVIANSEAGCEFARVMYSLPPARCHCVWNGIDLSRVDAMCENISHDYRKEFFEDSSIRMAVMVGTIQPQKDHMLAIDVAEALIDCDSEWRVAFVGASYGSKLGYSADSAVESGVLERAVQGRLERSRHVDRIRFVGQRDDALQIIASSDVLFSTSIQEGFPNVVLEAMATGTPVVSTEYSDIRRILQEPGWVVESRDPMMFADAIQAVQRDHARIGRALRHWVEQNSTIERSVLSLIDVYEKYTEA